MDTQFQHGIATLRNREVPPLRLSVNLTLDELAGRLTLPFEALWIKLVPEKRESCDSQNCHPEARFVREGSDYAPGAENRGGQKYGVCRVYERHPHGSALSRW